MGVMLSPSQLFQEVLGDHEVLGPPMGHEFQEGPGEETKYKDQLHKSILVLPPVVPHHTSLSPTYPRTYLRSRVPFHPRKAWAIPPRDSSSLSLQGQRAVGRLLGMGALRWEKPLEVPQLFLMMP